MIFIGEVDEETKICALEASDIFVFPSEWEAFGIVVIEAMARKNAIISTKTEGGRFLIKEGENGYLFDYQDKAQLLKLISSLISNNELRKEMQNNNYIKAKGFLWKDIVLYLEKIYGK